MSYQHFFGDIGTGPQSDIGPAFGGSSDFGTRPFLSLVPDATDPADDDADSECLGCEVKDRCLESALANDERFGIWGGLSERERRRLKRGII